MFCSKIASQITVVHSGHLFPKPSHSCCEKLPQHNTLKLLCCDSVWGKGGRCVPYHSTR